MRVMKIVSIDPGISAKSFLDIIRLMTELEKRSK